MSTMAIEVEGLVKTYGDRNAVDGIDLQVAEGEILAFLGPNGAGKTTTVEILEGYRPRTSGAVTVLGIDPENAPLSWRERIGIVLQDSEPVPELTAAESVRMQSHYYANPRNPDEILELVGLAESRDQRTRNLSGGQLRRLDLAMALVGDPELVFLDEPTTGFDPSARRESWTMIESLRSLGHTVLLTTHYMDEAQHLADRIAVIADGKIVATGTAGDLAEQVKARPTIRWSNEDGPMPPERLGWQLVDGEFRIEVTEVVPVLHELTSWALTEGVDLGDLEVSNPTLEQTYLSLTSQEDDR